MTAVRCDLVIPVYNALRSTRDCLDSVRRHAPDWARVVVVNDGSDSRTTEWLRQREGILLLENPVNLGFVKSANRGLLFSDAPYVCLLNSDTLLTEGALGRVLARLDADPSIALCCPISNEAVNLSVKVPPGRDVFSFAREVARSSPALYPDAVTVVGFCLVFRREAIRVLGVFDEVFGRGYCEETDYHYRCRAAGWRCVVADDTFLYHRHGASFSDRDARFARNVQILMARWRQLHEKDLAEFDRANALGAIRDDRYEWRLPLEETPRDVALLLSSLDSPAAPLVCQLANALILSGKSVSAIALDESAPPDSETFFRPLVLAPERLRGRLPASLATVACDEPSAAALALASEGRPKLRIGFLETAGTAAAGVRELFPARTSFDPRARDAEVLPLSPEPDLFYPRDGRKPAPFRAAAHDLVPADGTTETVSWIGLPREKRAALYGTSHAVVDLADESVLIALEAMASGAIPVVAPGSSGAAIVRDGETGRLARGAEEARRALLALARDAQTRERIASAALREARGRTWSATAEEFTSFCERLSPPAALDAESRILCERIVASRPRPVVRPAPPALTRAGLRARLGRLKRRLLA